MCLVHANATPGLRAGRREWIGLGVLTLPCLLYAMDLTVLNLAVPHLSTDLRPSSTQLLWIVDVYGFMVAGLLITMGTLGDRIGRRRVLLAGYWWGSVFLLAVPVMGLLLVLGPMLLPEFRDPQAGRLDLVSAGMSLAAVLAVVWGLKQFAQDGPGWAPAVSIVAGLAVGVAFVRRQHGLADPLLDLRLFRVPAFSAALTTNVLSFFVGFGALLFVAQYLQLVLGLSPLG